MLLINRNAKGNVFRHFLMLCMVLCMIAIAVPSGVDAAVVSSTVATFDDPSEDGSNHLFLINGENNTIAGGWSDTRAGLTLEVPISNGITIFEDAYFTMDLLNFSGSITNSQTGGGSIKFFSNGADPCSLPLVQIDFNSAYLTYTGLGSDEFFSDNGVTIYGSLIDEAFTEEEFSFSFSNRMWLDANDHSKGFTVTAAFTSSATPEPTTICLMGTGLVVLLRKRRR